MNRAQPLLLLLLFTLSGLVFSLQAQPPVLRGTGGIKSAEVPVYRSRQDSIYLESLKTELKKIVDQKPVNQKKMDSVWILREKVYRDGIIRFKTIYSANPSFFPFDSLSYQQDKSTITRLSISSKKLKRIPEEVFQCPNLEILEVVNSSLGELQSELSQLKSLKKIVILNNRINHPLRLKKNTVVAQIVLRGENPKAIPRSFRKFVALEKIDLSQTGLKKFYNGARHNRKLEELDLQRNQITLKKNAIKAHPHLQRLGLQYNRIEKIPSSIQKIPNLKKAAFNHNSISVVSPKIERLQKLEHLAFYNNKLTSVPTGVYELRSLKVIDLFHNRIYQLEDRIVNWSQLQTLYISNNYLVALPEVLSKLSMLTEVYAYDNLIKELPNSICEMTGLKVLRVNSNQLKELPACFEKLVNLEELDLSKNNLTQLPRAVFDFEKMKIFVLTENPWNADLEKAFPQLLEKMKNRDVAIHLSSDANPK